MGTFFRPDHKFSQKDFRTYKFEERIVIDLAAKRYCLPKDCVGTELQVVSDIRNDTVYFRDQPDFHWSFNVKNRKYVYDREDLRHPIKYEWGSCRKAPFSDFYWLETSPGEYAPAVPRPLR